MTFRPQRSDSAAEYHRWYSTARWQATRQRQLEAHPLCVMCEREGKITAASVCDHVDPHRGDPVKFWFGPFQSLCQPHHDSTKQKAEARGYEQGADSTGRPVDPNHPWNRTKRLDNPTPGGGLDLYRSRLPDRRASYICTESSFRHFCWSHPRRG